MTLKPLTRALGPLGVTSGTKHLWTPADMPSNMVLWLAADKITGLSDGASVASWVDASGTGSNATTSVSADRPIYKTNIINGLPVTRWNGTTNRMALTNLGTTLSALDTYSVFFLVHPTNFTSFPIVINYPDSNAAWQWLLEFDTSGGFYWGQAQATFRLYAAGTPVNTWVFDSVVKTAATAGRLWDNGTEITSFSTAGAGLTAAQTMNGNMALGTLGGTTHAYDFLGDMAEVIVYKTNLSDANRQLLEGYVAWKYGLQAALPSGHPYKSAAPLA